jgi:hypothetical protein
MQNYNITPKQTHMAKYLLKDMENFVCIVW